MANPCPCGGMGYVRDPQQVRRGCGEVLCSRGPSGESAREDSWWCAPSSTVPHRTPPPDAEPRGLVAADVPSLTFQEGVHLPYPVDAVVLLVQIFDHGKEQLVAQLARGGRAGLRGGDATRAASPDSYQAGLRHVGLWSSGSDARRRLGPGLASAVCARASRESASGSSWTILTSRTERNPGRFMLSLGTWCAD